MKPMLTIGITGHRILCETDKINAAFEQVYLAIKKTAPGQSCTLFSPLAEGADQLAAYCALKQGVELTALLPLPKAEYLEDFVAQNAIEGFETLLSKTQSVVELPPQETRNASYESVGWYILDHCDVLIAVWDGQGVQGQGGTGDIVAQARQRGLSMAWIHAGNRKPGTQQPTSLGEEQGKVEFEGNFWTARVK